MVTRRQLAKRSGDLAVERKAEAGNAVALWQFNLQLLAERCRDADEATREHLREEAERATRELEKARRDLAALSGWWEA